MSSIQWQILILGLIAIFFKYLIGVVLVIYYKLKDNSARNSNIDSQTHIEVPVYSDKNYRKLIVKPRSIWEMNRHVGKSKPIEF